MVYNKSAWAASVNSSSLILPNNCSSNII
ncbi:TPA: hypothetical protein ANIA_11659 [Aspergillus nidulans FGSC A4]|uniref:Uncharacterized protein n=1 Tax=Emericella nidulans (strain FGSC A4 / ATCC 38163 / CBS 112.46 / NRRL 194 / M139) TaxID=227321 RepID=C8VRL4_EMENI|nr:TPA: hypothetical protein ANIA_11659 [Aspergillus nidulans FGSC A4]